MAANPYDLALSWRSGCVTPSVTVGSEQDAQDATGRDSTVESNLA